MYKPAAFLISSAALTSIFSFFFGGYFRVAVDRTEKFPFFRIRQRVTGQDRLSKIWMILGCSKLKTPEYSQNKIPRTFYDNQEYYSKEKDRV